MWKNPWIRLVVTSLVTQTKVKMLFERIDTIPAVSRSQKIDFMQKYAQKWLKIHGFSKFWKFAKYCDIHILYIRKCDWESFEPKSDISYVNMKPILRKNIFWHHMVLFRGFHKSHLWSYRRNFYEDRNFDHKNFWEKTWKCFLHSL